MTVVSACFDYGGRGLGLEPFDVVVPGRSGGGAAGYTAMRARGGRVAQYWNIVDQGLNLGPYDARFSVGYPTLAVANWPGTRVIDLTLPTTLDKLDEAFKWAISQPTLTDGFSDVHGTRLWSAAWAAMTPAEQDRFAKSMPEIGARWAAIRDTYRPDARLYCNGTNPTGLPGWCGVWEHHTYDAFGRGYLSMPGWDQSGQEASFVISMTLADARVWATSPGIGPIAVQATYDSPGGIVVPPAHLIPRLSIAPPPPPPPPPPPDDPCADLRALLVTAGDKLTAANAKIVAGRLALA